MSLFSSFSKFKAIFAAVAMVEPILGGLIQQVEAAFPAGSTGATKLAAIKAALESIWATVQGVETDFESAWPTISALVSALVAIYNASGVFQHKSTTTA